MLREAETARPGPPSPALSALDEADYQRYLRARGGNLKKAAQLLHRTLVWRKEFDVGKQPGDMGMCLRGAVPLRVLCTAGLMIALHQTKMGAPGGNGCTDTCHGT